MRRHAGAWKTTGAWAARREGVLRIVNAVNSPWLQVLMDTGNFLEDPYDRLDDARAEDVLRAGQDVLRRWHLVRARPRLPAHRRDAPTKHNYRGWVSLEFEGKEDWKTAIPKSLAVLREAFGKKA